MVNHVKQESFELELVGQSSSNISRPVHEVRML